MKIRFSIWRDQLDNFQQTFLLSAEFIDLEVHVSDRLYGSYRGWEDFHVTGSIDKVCTFFHHLGDAGFNLHVFKDNPVDE